eukprot:SAG31_NODE_11449_length_1028_cov_2.362756_1_plen_323_part_10
METAVIACKSCCCSEAESLQAGDGRVDATLPGVEGGLEQGDHAETSGQLRQPPPPSPAAPSQGLSLRTSSSHVRLDPNECTGLRRPVATLTIASSAGKSVPMPAAPADFGPSHAQLSDCRLVVAEPTTAHAPLRNAPACKGAFVLVWRGNSQPGKHGQPAPKLSFVQKALRVQAAGGAACIIVDFESNIGAATGDARARDRSAEPLLVPRAAKDQKNLSIGVRIPVVAVSAAAGAALQAQLPHARLSLLLSYATVSNSTSQAVGPRTASAAVAATALAELAAAQQNPADPLLHGGTAGLASKRSTSGMRLKLGETSSAIPGLD